MSHSVPLTMLLAVTAGLTACVGPRPTPSSTTHAAATMPMTPQAVQLPAGHVVALETVGAGDITYECREKSGSMGEHEWVLVGPSAALTDRQGRTVGRYSGPPATWTAVDGSAVSGTKIAVAPASPCNGDSRGRRENARYQADYIFWKPA